MSLIRLFVLLALIQGAAVSAWAQSSEEDNLTGENAAELPDNYNRWGFSYFGATNLAQRQLEDTKAASLDVYNYIGVNYKLTRSTKLYVRPSFNVTSAGTNKYGDVLQSGAKLNDTTIGYANYNWFKIGTQSFSAALKLTLPTSEYAQQLRQIARIKFEMFTDLYDEGRWEVSYGFKPEYTISNETVAFDPNAKKYDDGTYMWDPRKGTKLISLDHGGIVTYHKSRRWEFSFFGGFSEDYYNGSVKEQLDPYHATYLSTSLAAQWRPQYGVSVSAGISNYLRLVNIGGPLQYGKPDDNSISVATNISL